MKMKRYWKWRERERNKNGRGKGTSLHVSYLVKNSRQHFIIQILWISKSERRDRYLTFVHFTTYLYFTILHYLFIYIGTMLIQFHFTIYFLFLFISWENADKLQRFHSDWKFSFLFCWIHNVPSTVFRSFVLQIWGRLENKIR